MVNGPLVSIIVPVFNGARYLSEAIHSLSNQTYRELEIIIVDDGSTDGSAELANYIRVSEQRVKLVLLGSQQGVAVALNAGLVAANGTLIARMDADDICKEDRLESQVMFLSSHPHVDILGTAITLIDDMGFSFREVYPPREHWSIRFLLMFNCTMIHPTIMRRWPSNTGGYSFYPEAHNHAEDYALWASVSESQIFHNLEGAHLKYRIHGGQVSSRCAEAQVATAHAISSKLILQLEPSIALTWEETQNVYQVLCHYYRTSEFKLPENDFGTTLSHLTTLLHAFIQRYSPPDNALLALQRKLARTRE